MVMMNPFYTDPSFTETQDYLMGLGKDIISGDLPDYYQPTGAIGGAELENLISQVNRDVSIQVDQDMARKGMGKSGVAQAVKARSIADASTKLRYADLQDALNRRMNLFGTGIGTLGDVGSKGLSYANAMNQWSLNKAQLEDQSRQFDASFNYKRRADARARKDAMWQSIGNLAGSVGGSILSGGASSLLSGLGGLSSAGRSSIGFDELSDIMGSLGYEDLLR